MIVKSRGGVRHVAFVRKQAKLAGGETEVVLMPKKRAARQPYRRFKCISKAMKCGRETGYIGDLRLVHRLDRRHMAAELRELIQSGGYQADIVKAGKLVPFQTTGKAKSKARAVIVGISGQPSYVY